MKMKKTLSLYLSTDDKDFEDQDINCFFCNTFSNDAKKKVN